MTYHLRAGKVTLGHSPKSSPLCKNENSPLWKFRRISHTLKVNPKQFHRCFKKRLGFHFQKRWSNRDKMHPHTWKQLKKYWAKYTKQPFSKHRAPRSIWQWFLEVGNQTKWALQPAQLYHLGRFPGHRTGRKNSVVSYIRSQKSLLGQATAGLREA